MISFVSVLTLAAAVQAVAPVASTQEPLWLAGGGMVGAFARAFFIKHQHTFSRETGFDIFVGGLVGLLWNVEAFGVWPLFDFHPAASYLQRAAIVAVVALVAVELVKRVLIKYAPAFLEDRLRAVLPTNGAKPDAK